MMWRRILTGSLEEIRVNRLRSLVTGLCICVAVTAFSLVMQLGQGARQSMTETVELTQGRAGTWRVTAQGAPSEVLLAGSAAAAGAPGAGVRAWGRAVRVGEVKARVRDSASGPAPSAVIGLLAVDPAIADVAPVPLSGGRWLTEDDARDGALPVVLSPGALRSLTATGEGVADASSLIGGELLVGRPTDLRLRIVGVAADGPLMRFQSEGDLGFVPIHSARADGVHPALAGLSGPAGSVQTYLLSGDGSSGAGKDTVPATLKRVLASAGHPAAQATAERVDRADDFAAATRSLSTVLGVIGAVALGVGVLGVANVSLMSVRERTQEFGLRSALGASPGVIAWLVLTETALVILAGGASGVLLAAILSRAAGAALGSTLGGFPLTPLSLSTATVGLAVSAASGLLAGLLPALRARRLSVVEAIRR
ncbi:ABC transporter permease [Streptomyces sp. NPDC098101]|uniref:ABC transporter permease n=1 Tax=Streptomyces sp. NPDC098101 TaxID=3366096 RepID=UPI0038218CCF